MGYNIKEGDVVEAIITSIKDFGAFADFGESSGLIYFTQIVPKVEHGKIDTILSVGQTVKCSISEIKPNGKIGLTMKLKKSQIRKVKLEEVEEDVKKMNSEDTSIRAIWKVLTEIQHYMLKYMQIPIPLKNGTLKFNESKDKLYAEIDTGIHFDNYCAEVRRVFSADVKRHALLQDYWYFETDMQLFSSTQIMSFVESCSNMYVNMDSYPSIEILIKGIETSSKSVLIDRLTNYYPDINLRRDDKELMLFTLPYSSHSAKNDYIMELKYGSSAFPVGRIGVILS